MRNAVSQDRFVDRQLYGLPDPLQRQLLSGHSRRVGQLTDLSTSPVFVANTWLRDTVTELKDANIRGAYDEHRLRAFADNGATMARRIPTLPRRLDFAVQCALKVDTEKKTETGLMMRLEDPLFWRRNLRHAWTSSAENCCRNLGMIRRGLSPYVTEHAKAHYLMWQLRTRNWVESREIENQEGFQLPLFEAVDASVSNPRIRRTELMVRMRGFEEIAQKLGHVGSFATLTAPSAFHAQLFAGGANPNFQQRSVRESQRWLCRSWARARAKLKRLKILYYGIRVVEANHDGTPHWHLLYFTPQHQAQAARAVIRAIWLKDFAHEAGAQDVRCKFVELDPRKGSAAGYIAKYVSKNIDGHGAIGAAKDNQSDDSCADSAVRIRAWACINRIRQFQQIGGPSVTLWRELRRLQRMELPKDCDIARALDAAVKNSWAGFTNAIGGIRAGRKTNLKVHKEETGELNRYMEPRAAKVVGVKWASSIIVTRPDVWTVKPRGVAVRHKSEIRIGSAPTWTRSNNCTPDSNTVPAAAPTPAHLSTPPGTGPPPRPH